MKPLTSSRKLLALVLAATALAVPASASAQDRFSDSFGTVTAPARSAPAPVVVPAPVTPAPVQAALPVQAAPTSTLPRTGDDPFVYAFLGLALLLCGVGLRLRSRPEYF
jgi:LPXTG-motif cell wall-anchored protein